MVGLVVLNFQAVSTVGADCAKEATVALQNACKAGAGIGGGMLAIGGWFLWLLGTLILGLLMFATRGKLVTYDVEE